MQRRWLATGNEVLLAGAGLSARSQKKSAQRHKKA
jgi:hypothetical protein